jgi:hypothetical protein
LLLLVAVAAVQVVLGSLITKQLVVQEDAPQANKHQVHLLQVLVVAVARKLLAETAAPHGAVGNLEQRARSEPVVTVVFTLQLLVAVAVAAILAAAAAALTTVVPVQTAAAAAAADPVFILRVAHVHKVFKLVMAKLSLLTLQALPL